MIHLLLSSVMALDDDESCQVISGCTMLDLLSSIMVPSLVIVAVRRFHAREECNVRRGGHLCYLHFPTRSPVGVSEALHVC